jgi:hypothetical protein
MSLIAHGVQVQLMVVPLRMVHEAGHDGAGVGVEDVPRVADAADHVAGHIRDRQPAPGGVVGRDEQHAAGHGAFGDDAGAGSWLRKWSTMASLTWSQSLSGWPVVTDSEVKMKSSLMRWAP